MIFNKHNLIHVTHTGSGSLCRKVADNLFIKTTFSVSIEDNQPVVHVYEEHFDNEKIIKKLYKGVKCNGK